MDLLCVKGKTEIISLYSLAEIANTHDQAAIDTILPALCRKLETANQTLVDNITSILSEKLSVHTRLFFIFGILTPRLEEITDKDIRLNLLLGTKNLSKLCAGTDVTAQTKYYIYARQHGH